MASAHPYPVSRPGTSKGQGWERRRVLGSIGGLGTLAAIAGLPFPAKAQDKQTFISIGTGTTTGTYFSVGSVIANVISRPIGSRACDDGGSCGVEGLIASTQTTKGSVDNILRLENGTLDAGLTQADIAWWAFAGEELFKSKGRMTNFSAVASLFPESCQLVVPKDSPIWSVGDLKGRRVALGEVGSGTLVDGLLILNAWGLDPKTVQIDPASTSAAADALIEGKVDAALFIAGAPTLIVQDLNDRMDIRLVDIAGPEVELTLLKRQPFFYETKIPEGTYRGVPEASTIAVGALFVASNNLEEDLVYEITESLFRPQSIALLTAENPQAAHVSIATATESVPIPYHPGAKRYYQDVGILS